MNIPTISAIAMVSSAMGIIVALSMFFLVLWQAPREPDNQLMAIYMFCVVFWGISAFMARLISAIGQDMTIFFYGIALGIGFTGLALCALASHYAGLWKYWWIRAALIGGLVYYIVMLPSLFQGRLYNNVQISNTGQLSYHFEPPGYITFVISYIFYLSTLVILWRFRKERPGNLLIGGVILTLGVLTSLSSFLAQYSIAIATAAIASVLFARAILNENLFNPLAQLNKELGGANRQLSTLAEELRIANMQLTEVSRLKSHFLANMSHELRTPLNSIIGYTEMLNEGIYGPLNEKQQDRLDRVMRNGQHLLQLINDILDLSKIEAGRMELDIEPVDLQGIVTECMAISEPLAQKKNLELTRDIPSNLPLILADRGRVVQVLMNLVSNAVKFTPEGQVTVKIEPITSSQISELPVELREGERGPWMLTKVIDTGIGISPDDQQIIFDEFRQADSSPSRQYEGTGLGLAITRKLLQMMHGHIWLQSVVGQGSTFYVLLPLVAEAPSELEVAQKSQD